MQQHQWSMQVQAKCKCKCKYCKCKKMHSKNLINKSVHGGEERWLTAKWSQIWATLSNWRKKKFQISRWVGALEIFLFTFLFWNFEFFPPNVQIQHFHKFTKKFHFCERKKLKKPITKVFSFPFDFVRLIPASRISIGLWTRFDYW